ncbi:MAG: RNA polymerase sigma factor [Angelakisella sp.]
MTTELEDQYDKIYRYCCLRVNNPQLAEDLTQETFLKYFSQNTYLSRGKPLAYLYTIAKNLCIDHYRKAQPQISQQEKQKHRQLLAQVKTPYDSDDYDGYLAFDIQLSPMVMFLLVFVPAFFYPSPQKSRLLYQLSRLLPFNASLFPNIFSDYLFQLGTVVLTPAVFTVLFSLGGTVALMPFAYRAFQKHQVG